jgi:hypothetical protein
VDLFAFSEAELQAIVQRIRDSQIAMAGIFDIATDYVRLRSGVIDADAEFQQTVLGARSRDFDSQIEAAVSLDVSAEITAQASADLNSDTAITASVDGFERDASADLLVDSRVIASGRITTQRPYAPTVAGIVGYSDLNPPLGSHSLQIFGDTARSRSITYTPYKGRMALYHARYTAIEFWTRNASSDRLMRLLRASDSALDWGFFVNSGTLSVAIGGSSGASLTNIANALPNTWNHVRLLVDRGSSPTSFSGNLAVYINGTRVATNTFNSLITTQSTFVIGTSQGFVGLDELRVLQSNTLFADFGWSLSDTTTTVPTQPYTNTEETQILLHFDNTALDDVRFLRDAAAQITATTAITASASAPVRMSATVVASSTLAAQGSILQTADADLNSESTLSCSADKIVEFASNVNSEFAVSAVGDIFVILLDTSFDSETNLVADVDKLPGLRAELSTQTNLTFNDNVRIVKERFWLPEFRSVLQFDNNQNDEVSNTGVTWRNSPTYFDSDPYFTFTPSKTFGQGIELTQTVDDAIPLITIDRGDRSDPRTIIPVGNEGWIMELSIRFPLQTAAGSNTIWAYRNYDNISGSTSGGRWSLNYIIINDNTTRYVRPRLNYSGVVILNFDDAIFELDQSFNDNYSQYFNIAIQFEYQSDGIASAVVGDYSLFVNGSLVEKRENVTTLKFDGIINLPFKGTQTRFNSVVIDEFVFKIGNNLSFYQDGFTVLDRPYRPAYDSLIPALISTNLEADVLKVFFGEVNAKAESTLIANNVRTREADTAALTATTNLAANGVKVAISSAVLESEFNSSVTAQKRTDVTVISASTVTQTTSGQRIRFGVAEPSASTDLDLEFGEILKTPGATTVNSEFAQAPTDYLRIRSSEITVDSVSIALTAAAKIGDFFVNMDTNSTLTAEATKTTDTPSQLNSEFAVSTQAAKSVTAQGTVSAVTDMITAADKIKETPINISASTGLDCSAVVVIGGEASITATTNIATTYTRLRFGEINVNSIATQICDGDKLRLLASDLTSSSTLIATAFNVQRAEAILKVNAFVLTVGDVINIDPQRILIVEQETRTIKVSPETRYLVVDQETRILKV